MKACFVRTKTKGQSIPIIALIIVVLFAMVGLAVDVGNTYAEQRSAVRASNAAALVGMHTLIVNGHDDKVYKDIVSSLESNGIRVANFGEAAQPGERVLTARYLDAKGNPVLSCPQVGACGSSTPQGVSYIQVQLDGKVDTYFARLVGTQNLPVGANSFAMRGTCTSGVYPIGIRGGDDYLTQGNGFTNPDRRYTDPPYRNKTVKRIYTHDRDTPNGGFHWLRWKADQNAGNATELEEMLAGPGNLGEGFTENPWPSSNSASLPKPDVYPTRPNQLNSGDWIHGNSGISNRSGVRAAMDAHIANRTVLNLPVYDAFAGNGNNADSSYHMAWLGSFLLLDYDRTGYSWFEVAYVGQANDCASLVSNAPKTTNLGLAGPVYFRPRWMNVPNTRPPVAYTIILDVSGSMSWNFAGQGWRGGRAIQCTGSSTANCNGYQDAWPTVNERRIKIAKDAINGFINQMATKDIMRIVSYSGNIEQANDNTALNQLTRVAPNNWSSDKTALKNAVTSIGAYNSDPYLTKGGTPSAVGIARATQIVAASPATAPSGEKYKRVAIFLTDGVANVFRNGTWNNAGGCGSEVASCHVGYTDSNPRMAKPVTAMALEAADLKPYLHDTNGNLYVIAMAGIDETGLRDVASQGGGPFFSTAESGAELNAIFADIVQDVKYGQCSPQGGTDWENTIAQENAADIPGSLRAADYPTVGRIFMYNESGTQLVAQTDIKVDAQTGRLSYSFGEVAPGIYQIKAFVGYLGPDDKARPYKLIFNSSTETASDSTVFELQASQSLGTVVSKEIRLDMDGSVCAQ